MASRGWSLKRSYTIARHQLNSALGSGQLKWRLFFFFAEVWVLVQTIFWANHEAGLTALGGVAGVRLIARLWSGTLHKNVGQLEQTSKQRRIDLFILHQKMGTWPDLNFNEVKAFQRSVLQQVASYARDMRGDKNAKVIFANLLVPDGDDMVVVARSEAHRALYTRFPKVDSVAWEAFSSGKEALTGDLYADHPTTVKGKKYCSVIALPVTFKGETRAVVTIDSTEKHHFDTIQDEVVGHVLPLIGMLGWTLQRTIDLRNGLPDFPVESRTDDAVASNAKVETAVGATESKSEQEGA